MPYNVRHEIITGIDGTPTPERGVYSIASVFGLAVTITPAKGYCAPWGDEDVLVITTYDRNETLVETFAEAVRRLFSQDSVAHGRTEARFNLHDGSKS
jgi:hypothetical protein